MSSHPPVGNDFEAARESSHEGIPINRAIDTKRREPYGVI